MKADGHSIASCASDELANHAPAIRQFLFDAFEGDFSDDDFDHCLGGRHFLMFRDSQLVGHAAVVSRAMAFDDLSLEVGYLEAMAVHPGWRGRGLGFELLAKATEFCREHYRVSMLSTDTHGFYERHGWRRLNGLSFVATDAGLVRTAEDDEGLMLLSDGDLIFEAKQVVCDFRSGDVW